MSFEEKNDLIIDLNDKVDIFIDWYYINMVKGKYTQVGEFNQPKDMRNLIEKIAVWYELRYPSYELNNIMPGSSQESININKIMFENNPCMKGIENTSDLNKIGWSTFYNTNVFINSLPWEERYYLDKPNYRDIIYLDSDNSSAHLHLTNYGTVEMAEFVTGYTNSVINDEELTGLTVSDVLKKFQERGIILPEDNDLQRIVKEIDSWTKLKNRILDCAMYRIIERGGNRIGPRRAFLFAKEFHRNIDIPMKYGIDKSDPGLRLFIYEYLKSGGSQDLICYLDYFHRTSKKDKLNTIKLKDLLPNQELSFDNIQEEINQLKLGRKK